jgi:hypothetical protein
MQIHECSEMAQRILSACAILLLFFSPMGCEAQSQRASSPILSQSSNPAVNAEDVWISPNDPTHGGAADFWAMFQPGADWARAEHHIGVV